ncbi:ATP-dependent dethiobiotin synthetase BioD [Variovorax paradoxus]|uniref:ATP-dependent dethiobiotin synthetase BioD n=1 Tax=Variovorax paradoxus TaxID=34073 RepID=UPI003ECC9CE1
MQSSFHLPKEIPAASRGACLVSGVGSGDGEQEATLALLHGLRQVGLRVAAMTPVVSDARRVGDRWTSPLLSELCQASSFLDLPVQALCPYLLRNGIYHESAGGGGGRVQIRPIAETFAALSMWSDVVVVKGMDGLSEKLGARLSTCDVASRLALPLVICLRHGPSIQSRLSQALKQARRRDIAVAGWIATGCDPGVVTALEELSQSAGLHCLGAITKVPRSELELTYGLNLDVICRHLQLRSTTTDSLGCP